MSQNLGRFQEPIEPLEALGDGRSWADVKGGVAVGVEQHARPSEAEVAERGNGLEAEERAPLAGRGSSLGRRLLASSFVDKAD
ncbi:MAG: hypothetical protein IT293_12185 [Deltaproteobacteria bacterium]|nr:hypothetical protein [Deltaproteobacteria bacterium]